MSNNCKIQIFYVKNCKMHKTSVSFGKMFLNKEKKKSEIQWVRN